MKLLKTDRLIIQEFTINDAPFYYALVNDPDWIKYIGKRNINSIADAEQYLTTEIIVSYEKFGFGFYLVKTIDGNHSIGTVGLIDREGMDNVEVGFAFLPGYRSKGFAFEATKAILDYAAKTLKISPIVAVTHLENKQSGKLLERLGFRFDKIIKPTSFEEPKKLFIPKN